ncbi:MULTISPECIES: transketolase C-terminal domain-containing protein [environmental samples]|jgi:transketolase|uniref:transketolase family protein n=1 Tax=environmental samples TaxID=876090 RepID=UPI00033A64FD|nr:MULTISPECIES: transketolase C-terminal domain-containing protein [environmental samples]CDC68105.1 transketolase subunit B [Oscillibacter sp. CAG:155]
MSSGIQSVISDSNVVTNHPTMAEPFGNALIELAKENDRIVGLSADLAKYTDIHIFRDAFPDRFYNVGMSEQLMMCAASGLAKEGFIPFATTYATFIARRCYDFISQAICEHNTNVKIIGGLPGLQSGYGPSHQATDDLAILGAMPNLTIIDPCDAVEMQQATRAAAEFNGPIYLRLLRGNRVPKVLDQYDYHFEIGKAKLLRDGADVLLISCGEMTMRCLDAAEALEKDNIHAAVLHVPTIKPLDKETILKEIQKSDRLVITAENHTVVGGLGSLVANLLVDNQVSAVLKKIALPDKYLAAGTLETLQNLYGVSTEAVTAQIKAYLE